MKSVLLATVAIAFFSLETVAQETVVQLHVQPMAAPEPALKYQLLPQLDELNPGNAAQNYLKCFMEQHFFFFGKQAVADRDRFEVMALADLPKEAVRGYGGSALRQADWAARMESLDWQSLSTIQKGGTLAPPSEIGPMQVLGKALHVRFRGEVAERKFDDAVTTAKTMFALSRHLGEHPTEVANLVALWVSHVALSTIEEMVQQAKCPNLYWALTDLPSPPVDLRKGIQGEQTMITAELKGIRADSPMTEAEFDDIVGRLSGVISFSREQSGQPPRSIKTALRATAKDALALAAAKLRLVKSGCKEEAIAKFPVMQVVLLDQKHRYEIERDERLKLLAVPVWQVQPSFSASSALRLAKWPISSLLPNVDKLRAELAELERQVAILRYVEALRLYAAEHDGKLPAVAASISVPLPADPVSGKAFAYRLEGTTAHLRGDSLARKGEPSSGSVHYSVTVHQ